jgi:hypothetical protein
MALQEINLGTYANDGTGDDLRTAFEKVKANFTDIYNSLNGANVGAEPPTVDVDQGELWWNTLDGRLYIKYSTAWVDASPESPSVVYDISAVATTGGANLQLNGSDASIDAIKIASSTNITVTRTDANTITLSSTSYTGDVVGNLTGNVTGNVTGNAGTVTNGVYTNGVYSDPVWITSLAGNKIQGDISGKAGTVTNGVYTTSSVNELADVNTVSTPPTTGQALVWDGTNWVPGSVASGGGTLDFGSFTSPSGFTLDMGTF